MGSLVTDTATVSKAALLSSVAAFRRLGSKSSHSNNAEDASVTDRPSVSVKSKNNLDRMIYGPAKYDQDMAIGKLVMSNALLPEESKQSQQSDPLQPPKQEDCAAIFAGLSPEEKMRCIDAKFPTHKAARNIFQEVMVQKGLAAPGSETWQYSLPELMTMVPNAENANKGSKQQLESASTGRDVVGDQPSGEVDTAQSGRLQDGLNAEDSTAGSAHQENSQAEHRMAGSAGIARSAYGGELGEQWAGSQSPDQVVNAGLSVAAENEATAQASDCGTLQRVEEGSEGLNASSEEGQILLTHNCMWVANLAPHAILWKQSYWCCMFCVVCAAQA